MSNTTTAEAVALTFEDLPVNASTGNPYTGSNIKSLLDAQLDAEYPSPQWAGYNQWLSVGRQVRKGETGTRIVMVVTKKNKKTGKKEKVIKTRAVFNLAQTEAHTGVAA